MAATLILRPPGRFDRAQATVIGLFFGAVLIGLLQLIPIPLDAAAVIARRVAEVRAMVAGVVEGLDRQSVAVALDRGVTTSSVIWLLGLLGLGISASLVLARGRLRRLTAWVIVSAGAFQALYGAVELLSGRSQIFFYQRTVHLESATGTFINRNHFAAYLVIVLPFALGLTVLHARAPASGANARLAVARRRLLVAASAAAAALIWGAILLSSSRSGLLAAATVTFAFVALSSGRRRAALIAVVLVVAAAAVVSLFEVRAPGERFAAPSEELETLSGRLPVWSSAARIAREHPVLGVGLGNFESVYRLYQPAAVHGRWPHAHNEWLEWTIEGGCALLAIAIGIAITCAVPVIRIVRRGGSLPPLLLATSASLIGLVVHSAVDFGLRIPAIATLATIVVALHLAETGEAAKASPRPAWPGSVLKP